MLKKKSQIWHQNNPSGSEITAGQDDFKGTFENFRAWATFKDGCCEFV